MTKLNTSTLIIISIGRDKQEPVRMARELTAFQATHGIINPITVEQVESAHAMDVRCGNWEHERAWDVFSDMIATASRRVPKPDGDINPYAIGWHPDDPTTLVYAPESFWDGIGGVS